MDQLYQEALDRFDREYQAAINLGVENPSAMALATSDTQGSPSLRMVNLKWHDKDGFVFFTNLESGKGRQLADNPRAALCFYWQRISKQIVIEGCVTQLPEGQADKFWEMRSHEHKIAAWASHQSEPMVDAVELKGRLKKYRAVFPERQVPRPPCWAGFQLKPDRLEFWRSGWRDMKGRNVYELGESGWTRQLLSP